MFSHLLNRQYKRPETPSVRPSQFPTTTALLPSSKRPTFPPFTVFPTSSPTFTATTRPTEIQSFEPSQLPSNEPSPLPTRKPTHAPFTAFPTVSPSGIPSYFPSSSPSQFPSQLPTGKPTWFPTRKPTLVPFTAFPTTGPSLYPSPVLSELPSTATSLEPSLASSEGPSAMPVSQQPTPAPTEPPFLFSMNSLLPLFQQSPTPSPTTTQPSGSPTSTPSALPSLMHSFSPSDASEAPSLLPSNAPSFEPSAIPSTLPSNLPTTTPSETASALPSNQPSENPSSVPTDAPSVQTDAPFLSFPEAFLGLYETKQEPTKHPTDMSPASVPDYTEVQFDFISFPTKSPNRGPKPLSVSTTIPTREQGNLQFSFIGFPTRSPTETLVSIQPLPVAESSVMAGSNAPLDFIRFPTKPPSQLPSYIPDTTPVGRQPSKLSQSDKKGTIEPTRNDLQAPGTNGPDGWQVSAGNMLPGVIRPDTDSDLLGHPATSDEASLHAEGAHDETPFYGELYQAAEPPKEDSDNLDSKLIEGQTSIPLADIVSNETRGNLSTTNESTTVDATKAGLYEYPVQHSDASGTSSDLAGGNVPHRTASKAEGFSNTFTSGFSRPGGCWIVCSAYLVCMVAIMSIW